MKCQYRTYIPNTLNFAIIDDEPHNLMRAEDDTQASKIKELSINKTLADVDVNIFPAIS